MNDKDLIESIQKVIDLAQSETVKYEQCETVALIVLLNACANFSAQLVPKEERKRFIDQISIHFENNFKHIDSCDAEEKLKTKA